MFKAKFGNIGPIKEAKLELGDMTIISGENNTGKTYLAYTLYGFLDFCRKDFEFYLWNNALNSRPSLKRVQEIFNQLESHGESIVDGKEMHKYFMKNLSKVFSKYYMQKVFNSTDLKFEKSYFEIQKEEDQREGAHISVNSVYKDKHETYSLTTHIKDGNWIFTLERPRKEEIDPDRLKRSLAMLLACTVTQNFPKAFILPAERLSISLLYKALDSSNSRLVGELQHLSGNYQNRMQHFRDVNRMIKHKSAHYTWPVRDSIDFARGLVYIQNRESHLPKIFFDRIEDISNGYYQLVEDEIRFISKKNNPNPFDISLHLASSSARGISDLYFYLKHLAEPGELLMIDEPESHLSPTNQILMARILALCVNYGFKVLITTHSDYIIKEINNLIMLSNDFKGKKEFIKENNSYTSDDYLKPDSVKAYICEKGALTPCHPDKMGIDMPIFDDAIRGIDQVAENLYWKMQEGKE